MHRRTLATLSALLACGALVAAPRAGDVPPATPRAADVPRATPRAADVPRDDLPADFGAELPLGLPADYAAADRGSALEVALGRRLFFDPLLSVDRSVACASCHDPKLGFADDIARSAGVNGNHTLRNAPTLYNRGLGQRFMWDGEFETLEDQVLMPIQNELEMGMTLDAAVARLAEHGEYPALFEAACGGPPDSGKLARVLASFLRQIVHGGTPVDRFRAGEFAALTPSERSGLWLYESRGGCWRCHPGPLFTDEQFHATGVGAQDGVPQEGRLRVTRDEADRGGFKTPTLRGLLETAPYMHDGSLATLADVIEFYRRGGNPHSHLDSHIAPIELSDADAANLVAFLEALSRR